MFADFTPAPIIIPAQLPFEVQAALRSMGPVVAPQPTETLLAPLHKKDIPADVHIQRDVPYGPHPRNRLDIFRSRPVGSPHTGPCPVLLFVHGGAFMRGDRQVGDGTFHDNIGLWAARHGMVGVNMSYRLAPEHGWPSAQEDIHHAIQTLQDAAIHDPELGGPLVLMGHSAGAAHIAQYLAFPAFHLPTGPAVRAAVLLSGLFDPQTAERNPPLRAYFGNNESRYPEMSSIPGLVASALPLWIGYAALDPEDFIRQAHQLGAATQTGNRPVAVHMLEGHSHMSEIYAIGTTDGAFTTALLNFVRVAV